MKNKKIIPLFALSFAALGAVVGCNNSKSPEDTPAVHVYATSENGYFKDEQCIQYQIEDEADLKYGKEVKIHIQPKRWFRLNDFDAESWTRDDDGDYVKPYVGLGSPSNRYSFQLQENVAYTYTKEFEKAEDPESFLLTVKPKFFQKNLIIDFGSRKDDTNKVKEIQSTHYRDMIINNEQQTLFNYASYGKDEKERTSLFGLVNLENNLCNFGAGADSMILTYSLQQGNFSSNPLLTFQGLDEIDDDGNYSNLKVVGIKEDGEEILSKKDENNYFNVKISSNKRRFSIYINWNALAEGAPSYDFSFNKIEVYFSPAYKTNVNFFDSSSGKVAQIIKGYQNTNKEVTQAFYGIYDEEGKLKEEHSAEMPLYKVLGPAEFMIQDYDPDKEVSKYTYNYFYNCSVEIQDRDYDHVDTRGYFSAFRYEQGESTNIVWPKVTITREQEGNRYSEEIDTVNVKKTTNRPVDEGSDIDNNLCYCTTKDGLWQLICINSKGRREGIPYKGYFDNHNYFIVAPKAGTSAFKYSNTDYFANSINITVK